MGRTIPMRRLVGSRAAIRAHVIARGALLDVLSRDAAVVGVFGEFGTLSSLAYQLGALGNAIAHDVGLADRAALFAPGAQIAIESPAYLARNAAYVRAVAESRPALEQRLRALVFDTWQLDWAWLVYELDQHFMRLLNSFVTGDLVVGTFSAPPPTLPPPPAPEPGESSAAYQRRVRAFHAKPRDRTGVRIDTARIERDVRIFYRLRLKQPPDPIRAVAKAEGLSPWNTKLADARARKVLTEPMPRLTPPSTH